MNTTKLKLTNPTDDELSAAVAEHVAGWKYLVGTIGGHLGIPPPPNRGIAEKVTSYATSADVALPLLLNAGYVNINLNPFSKVWTVIILNGKEFVGDGHSLPRAACIALLRANGIEVEITPQPAQK